MQFTYPKTNLPFLLLWKLCSILLITAIVLLPLSFGKISSSGRSSRRAHYGSPCNSSIKCDIHSLLTCEENVCHCLYPDAMTYNAELGTCVSLVNEICGYLETKRVFINCVPNAYCDQQQGVCKCSQAQGYVEGERVCMKQKSYGESCHSDNECMTELSLTCFEEVCQCDPKRHTPENNLSVIQDASTLKGKTKCVTLAGLPCNGKTGCVRKASCVTETESDGTIPSSTFGWLHPGICKCESGYEIDGNSHCRGKYGSHCDVLDSISCVQKFQCLDGICHCKFPDDQIFHEETGKCVSLAGGPCFTSGHNNVSSLDSGETSSNEEEILCDQFMECRNSTCTCKSGFVENLDRGCDLSFGQFCTGKTMGKCDAAAGLHCVDGRCTCKDKRKEYSTQSGRCVGTKGSLCKMPSTLSRRGNHALERTNGKLPCSENMKCQASRTQLEDVTSLGFCTPSEGGGVLTSRPAMESRNRIEQHALNSYEPSNEDENY